MTEVDDIFKKYGRKLDNSVRNEEINVEKFSRDYKQFKQDMSPELNRYERWCRGLGNIMSLKIAEKDRVKVQKQLDAAHLDVTPSQVLSLAIVALMLVFFMGMLAFLLVFLLFDDLNLTIFFVTLFIAIFLFYYLYSAPQRYANKWRLKASSQMVPCILYIVAYMRHTSNLERAIVFAAKHLQPPLSLDFRKVLWDVETGKYSSVKESLEAYLETWRGSNLEFIESFHLIESSLFEPSEERRVAVLERALQVILDGVYENMMKYAREIRSPLTNVYMLGIVLPTLGISLIPLASALLSGMFEWYHLFIVFNLIIPFMVFYLTSQVLMKRPGGYGETDVLEMNPDYAKYKSKAPYVKSFLICLPLIIIGLLPFILYFGFGFDATFSEIGLGVMGDVKLFDFRIDNGKVVGPFGPMAVILSLFIPLGIALFFSIAYKEKTKMLMRSRNDSKQLEQEFTNSLFQLGNRLGDGVPAEIAFSYVAEATKGQATEGFFKTVNMNLHQTGMSLEESIFNPRRGAILYYPSNIIATSMKILIESAKKGLQIAARSLMSISEYMKNINKINERLRDLLAEVVSDMKSNMVFLAPLLAGIVVGLGGMITTILGKLSGVSGLEGAGGEFGSIASIVEIMDMTKMIPPYYLQLAIGIYIVEIVFILSKVLVTVDAGEDRLRTTSEIGKNLGKGMVLYLIVALISISLLTALASSVLGGSTFG